MQAEALREQLKAAQVPVMPGVREKIRVAVEERVQQQALLAPMSLSELEWHAAAVRSDLAAADAFDPFIMLLLANATWRGVLRSIPYERRLLLLPICLRDSERCKAEIDAVGLLCAECGACDIMQLQRRAEALGYVVIVAEGTTVVKRLISSGRVDAVVGVGCMEALLRTFSSMLTHAVPGLAVPLLRSGCKNTRVDTGWLSSELKGYEPAGVVSMPEIDALRDEVDAWFESPMVPDVDYGDGLTEKAGWEWVSVGGKRWRPLLAAAAFRCLGGDPASPVQRSTALAVECFHKASLIHDDIQDSEEVRYGAPAMHRKLGVPLAINVGDFLLGEGYRLIAESGAGPEKVQKMVAVAASGHIALCRGQGGELAARRWPVNNAPDLLLEQFALKTSPAFEVALLLGAISAGADDQTCQMLGEFSRALGIAYQIRDDLDDHGVEADQPYMAVSLLSSLKGREADPFMRAEQLFEHYRNQALRSLSRLPSATLAGFLRRATVRILGRDSV